MILIAIAGLFLLGLFIFAPPKWGNQSYNHPTNVHHETNRETWGPVWVQKTEGEEGEKGDSNATYYLPIILQEEDIIKIKFTIQIIDYDINHKQTDEGSDQDEVSVTAYNRNATLSDKDTTPNSIIIEYEDPTTNDTIHLSKTWNITLKCGCKGGKQVQNRFGTTYLVDQGFQFTLIAEYTYIDS